MDARGRHRRGEPDEQGQRVHVDGHGPAQGVKRLSSTHRSLVTRTPGRPRSVRKQADPSGSGRSVDMVRRAEAIFGPRNEVEHATGAAASKAGLAALREAAVAADRATRTLRKRDPDEALRAWEALVAGRWSLVAQFDTEGRRLLLAEQNEPAAFADEPRLSLREQQVAGYLLLGHPHKLIAYELGLAEGTVSTLVARIKQKLRARSAVDLLQRLDAIRRRDLAR